MSSKHSSRNAKRPRDDLMEAGDFTKPGPLKPPIISDAGEKAPFKLSITNKTPKPIYVTVEVGNSWDWELIKAEQSHSFATYKELPYLACSYNGEGNYFESCMVCDANTSYELLATSAKGAFKIGVVEGSSAPREGVEVLDMTPAMTCDEIEALSLEEKQEARKAAVADAKNAPTAQQQAPAVKAEQRPPVAAKAAAKGGGENGTVVVKPEPSAASPALAAPGGAPGQGGDVVMKTEPVAAAFAAPKVEPEVPSPAPMDQEPPAAAASRAANLAAPAPALPAPPMQPSA